MRATPQLYIGRGCLATVCERHDVMEFQEAGFGAAALFSLKCASPAVARPHVALDGRGLSYVSRDTVHCTLYRSGASGLMTASRTGAGAAPTGADETAASGSSAMAGVSEMGCGTSAGNLRTIDGTSGYGRRRAINSSTSRLLTCLAESSSSR